MRDDIKKKWKEAEKTGERICIGNTVICDICSEDYTDSLECGGFIFTSKAYCPECARELLPRIIGYNEEGHIKARCPQFQAFADFVRKYRGDNNFIQIIKNL